MIAASSILLAAPGVQEIFSVLVAIVFFVVWLVNQIADAKKQQREKEAAQAELPPEQVDAPGAAPAAPQDPLRAQVDEFLRRAGKKPGDKPAVPSGQRKPPAREEIVVLLDDSVAEPPRRPLPTSKAQPKSAPASRDKRTPASPAGPRIGRRQRGKSVAEHVAEHSGAASSQFRQEVADLGQRVKQADEQFDRQLQQKFGHELGTLASRTTNTEPAPQIPVTSPAQQIAELMASPDGVRQAIVLNEILRRPTDRW